jgi:putative flavoprotein involved in K+ transport
VFGCGTSAHDICQDLHSHGAKVTMVQRGPTTIVNLEPSAQLYDQIYYTDGPPVADRDLINSSVPLPLLKKAHKLLTQEVKKIDEPILTALAKVGMQLDFGEDDTGWSLKYRTRGGGYYFNAGCSELIASGEIDLVQFSDVAQFDQSGLQMRDGSHRNSDMLVMATGYHNQDVVVREWFGDAVADRVGPIWGFDDKTQEMRNMWTRTGQDGLWFTAGAFSQARIYSKYLAMQIRAETSE